jgi:Na+/melibiose symporter-like transporter
VESLATACFDPARAAALPLVVRRREVPRANGFEQGAATVAMVVGPLAGAALFGAGGLGAALGLNACTFLSSAVLLGGVRVRRPSLLAARGEPQPPAGLAGLRAGWAYLARHRAVLQLTVLFFVSLLCGGVWLPLAPSFMREVLGSPDRLLGLHLGAFGVGGLLGSLLAPRLGSLVDRGLVLFVALLAEGGQIAAYSLVPDAAASAFVLLLWGITVAVIRVSFYSILQLEVAESLLGRAFAVVKQAENAAILLATTLAVLLSQHLSSQGILLAAGLTYTTIVAASSLTAGGRTLLGAR